MGSCKKTGRYGTLADAYVVGSAAARAQRKMINQQQLTLAA